MENGPLSPHQEAPIGPLLHFAFPITDKLVALQYACTLHSGKGQEQREFALASLNRLYIYISFFAVQCMYTSRW